MMTTPLGKFIRHLPKAELHLHIEGTLEPELLFAIAARNKIPLTYPSITALRDAYQFNDLQDFLDIYYRGASVLLTEEDFYDLALAYFTKAHEENIRHAEIFFDPQTHTVRGVPFETVIAGLHRAQVAAEKEWGITSKLIMCFLRHLDEADALRTLDMALPYKKWIAGIGLDSGEQGNPPSKFQAVYKRAAKEGFFLVAHAGEEGPAEYVTEALDLLNVKRIDHGNHALDDAALVMRLRTQQIPLTVCPLSNLKLRVIADLREHPLRKMIDAGLLITVNSDDPAYFGGYLSENYCAIAEGLDLSHEELRQLAINSFTASFLEEDTKKKHITEINGLSMAN
ncbi:MAG: adenosine deaminase [Candidatus Lloydbacteria bacterium RIFCSPHIGHO2_01_FULL_49_22]|uniref:Adenine deaminase n=1 Tax=Candidatus Lloydbacteria bacterium RIFCSPHIGHO2_01_FULL_49_22 TaxID=1798658 RepID=A0A1G2CWI6_9BACT|nr:MAG: adenosine deaminase [Candidatus Lloydbacteria bacterium RIFCSPHIGHO2_01_FULL_49_22]OGZ10086.1 MAG: adenosine deaminase [Candidatus Lloydbacteria bacterium RIFCSPHIGHO2_02_FULL_50_18]